MKFKEKLGGLKVKMSTIGYNRTFRRKFNIGVQLIITLIFVLNIPVVVYLLNRPQDLRTQASVNEAEVFFFPETETLPPDKQMRLMIQPRDNDNISFVRATITFDNTKVQLVGEVSPTSYLSTVISSTPMDEANNSGRVTLVMGLTPGDSAPDSVFVAAEFMLTSISSIDDDLVALSVDASDIQLVNSNAQAVSGLIMPTSIVLNPVAPTNTPTPIATLTTAPTNTPVPTISADVEVTTSSGEIALAPTNTLAPLPTETPIPPAESPTPTTSAPTPAAIPTLAPIAFGPSAAGKSGREATVSKPTSSPVPKKIAASPKTTGESGGSSRGGSGSGGGSPSSGGSSPSSTSASRKKGDVNRDGKVSILDLSIMLSRFNRKSAGEGADLNGDGNVNILDLSIMLSGWGK